MNYGILTFHNIPNIGALMQALSLCEAYRREGVKCEIIDYKCKSIIDRECTFHRSSNLIKDLYLRICVWPKLKKKIASCQTYMEQRGIYSPRTYDKDNIREANNVYDVFISGSDMIWNTRVTGKDFSYFLDFTEDNKKRIACGSSVGDKWEEADIPHILTLLKRYDCIAVREADTCATIQSHSINCLHICDPTMLHKPQYWVSQAIPPKLKGYILVYFGYPEIMAAAKKYAKSHKLRIVLMNWGMPKLRMKVVGPNTPPEWMGYFMNAEAVFTDSFHGLLYSIYFQKKVWTANTGNRIQSLLESLDMTGCLVQNDPELSNQIDYESCHKQLDRIRLTAKQYIKETIQICKI